MNHKVKDAFILPVLLLTVSFISILIVLITSLSINTYNLASRESQRVNAQLAVDAGLDVAMIELTTDDTYTGTTGEVEVLNSGNTRTTYEVTVINTLDPAKKIIRSIGRTYNPSTSTTPKFTRKYEVDAEAVTSGNGPASVVSGVGGLIVENNAKISGGDVIVNGRVTVNNNGQIGLSTNPINLRVAHQNCPNPVNATYPQVCGVGENGEPITANGPIYGNVQATNQTNGANMFNPGLIPNSSYPPVAVPGYDRAAHKSSLQNPAAVVGNPSANGYNPSNAPIRCSGGVANWPANSKITGNVSLPNNCVVTINGNVWITGNLAFGNNSRIVVPGSMGTTRPVIMIDGTTGLTFGNNSQVTPNNLGTGVEFITMWWNTNTATNGGFNCGGITDPFDCTAVTGLALSTSQNATTINFNNNANAPGSVLRSLWSRTEIANNGALGAVSGQTILLRQNAVINFTASIPGSDNLVVTWVKRGYMRVFD